MVTVSARLHTHKVVGKVVVVGVGGGEHLLEGGRVARPMLLPPRL